MLFMTEGSMEEITWRGFAFFFFFFIKSLIFWVFSRGSITQFKLGYFVLVADFFFAHKCQFFYFSPW